MNSATPVTGDGYIGGERMTEEFGPVFVMSYDSELNLFTVETPDKGFKQMVVRDLGEPLTAGEQGMEDRRRQILSEADQVVSEQVVPKKARALMILLKRTDLTNATLFKSPLVIGSTKTKGILLFDDRNIVLRLSKLLAAGVVIADTEDDDSCRKFVCELDAISALAPTISTNTNTSGDTLPADCLSGMQFRKNCWCKTDERMETTLSR
jgi:hypothetical protein